MRTNGTERLMPGWLTDSAGSDVITATFTRHLSDRREAVKLWSGDGSAMGLLGAGRRGDS